MPSSRHFFGRQVLVPGLIKVDYLEVVSLGNPPAGVAVTGGVGNF